MTQNMPLFDVPDRDAIRRACALGCALALAVVPLLVLLSAR
jgi:hypothetical protein